MYPILHSSRATEQGAVRLYGAAVITRRADLRSLAPTGSQQAAIVNHRIIVESVGSGILFDAVNSDGVFGFVMEVMEADT